MLILCMFPQIVFASNIYWINGCNSKSGWSEFSDPTFAWEIDTTDYHKGNASFLMNVSDAVGDPNGCWIKITHWISNFPDMPSYTYFLCFWIKVTQIADGYDYANYPNVITNDAGVGCWKSGAGFVFTTMYFDGFWKRGSGSSTVRTLNTWYKVEANVSATGMEIYINGDSDVSDSISRDNVKPTYVKASVVSCKPYGGVHEIKIDTIYFGDMLGLDPEEMYEEEPEDEGYPTQIDLSGLPNVLAIALNISIFGARMLLSSMVLFGFMLPIAVFSKKEGYVIPLIVGVSIMGFLIAIQWLDYWILLIVALIVAGLWSNKIKGWVS